MNSSKKPGSDKGGSDQCAVQAKRGAPEVPFRRRPQWGRNKKRKTECKMFDDGVVRILPIRLTQTPTRSMILTIG